jgi:hypothetical protein
VIRAATYPLPPHLEVGVDGGAAGPRRENRPEGTQPMDGDYPPKPLSALNVPYSPSPIPLRGLTCSGGIAMRVLCAFLLIGLIGGCGGDWIHARAIQPAVTLVTDDYENYVDRDPGLSDLDRAAKLQTARMLRDVVERAMEGEDAGR